MCRKYQRRCSVVLGYREEAYAEWAVAESLEDVRRAWGRLGGKVTYHRYGPAHYAQLARSRRRCEHGDG